MVPGKCLCSGTALIPPTSGTLVDTTPGTELEDANPPETEAAPVEVVQSCPNPKEVAGGVPRKKFVDDIDVGLAINILELTILVMGLVAGALSVDDGGLAPLASLGAPVVGSRYQFAGGSPRHSPTVTSW